MALSPNIQNTPANIFLIPKMLLLFFSRLPPRPPTVTRRALGGHNYEVEVNIIRMHLIGLPALVANFSLLCSVVLQARTLPIELES